MPVAVSVVVVIWVLLVNVRLAVSAPTTRGLYVIVNDALCPAGMIFGSDKPPIANRELLEVAAVTVTFAPAAESVPVALPLAPVNTLPTATGVGDADSVPAVVEPVPDKAMVNVGLDPFEVTVTLPLALLADAGVKVTVKEALCPAATVAGVEIPLTVKPVPLAAT